MSFLRQTYRIADDLEAEFSIEARPKPGEAQQLSVVWDPDLRHLTEDELTTYRAARKKFVELMAEKAGIEGSGFIAELY